MTTVTREHLAGLELFKSVHKNDIDYLIGEELDRLIAQASAAPEQEPVAWACAQQLRALNKAPGSATCAVWNASGFSRVPLYTHPSAEIERLRAENKRLDLALAQADHNYDCDRQQFEQRLADAQALLAKSVASVRYQQGMQNLDHDAGRAHEKRFADLADAIDAFLSATAQPAECELMTFAQFVEKAARILDEEQGRLSEENYLMDSEDCIKVLREYSQPAEDQNDE